jgi:hypothetical protein
LNNLFAGSLDQVLSGLNKQDLKRFLRKIKKAGGREAVLSRLVDDAAVSSDRQKLEAVIAYGSPTQVKQPSCSLYFPASLNMVTMAHCWAQPR